MGEHSVKDLLLYVAKNLVENPDAVTVTEVEGDHEMTLELRVAPEDMGKVIGRQGYRNGIPTPVFFIHFKGVFRYFRYLLDPNLKYFYDFSFKLS